MKKTLSLLIILTFSSYCHAQKEKIELNLTKGETYKLNMMADMAVVQNMNGQDHIIKVCISGKINYKVVAVLDTTYEIEVKYESLGIKMDMPSGVVIFNSEKENSDDMFSKVLSAMKKKTFGITISKYGKILAVKNIENIFNAFNELPQLPQTQKEQFKKQLSESYGEKTFKSNLEMSLSIFPRKPVSKGERWTVKGKLESGMLAELETVYELKEIGSDYYQLTGTSKITMANSEIYTERNGMLVKSNLNGTMTAEIKINKKTGWVISSITDQQINGTTYIKESEQLPGGLTLPLKMNNVITVMGQ